MDTDLPRHVKTDYNDLTGHNANALWDLNLGIEYAHGGGGGGDIVNI